MRTFNTSLVIFCWLAFGSTGALACNSQYESATGRALLSCVEVTNETRAYDVALQFMGGNTFSLTGSLPYDLMNPSMISGLRVLVTPLPTALVFGFYPNGCWSSYRRPTFVRTGNNVDIVLKARVLASEGIVCTPSLAPFVESVHLVGIETMSDIRFTVNGAPVHTSFQ